MTRLSILGIALLVTSCGSTPAEPTTPLPDPVDVAEDQDPLAQLNERARQGAVTENFHGIEVLDPYRALEEVTALTREWINAQTERTGQALEPYQTPAMEQRLSELLSIGVIGHVAAGGNRIFYTKREGDAEQPSLYMAEGTEKQRLVDPTDHGERAAIDWFFPSPSGRLVAFGISHNGDERSTLHVLEVASNQVLPDRIARTKWTSVAWLHDESGFYYRRYPNPNEPNFDAEHEDTYFPRIFFHRLGSEPASDPLIYGSHTNTDFPAVGVSDDDRWLTIQVFRGWSASDLYVFDRGQNPRNRRLGPDETHPAVPISVGEDNITTGEIHRGKLYLLTNREAPRYRIAIVPVDGANASSAWQDIVPQEEGTIDSFAIVNQKLVVHVIENVQSTLRIHELNGRLAGPVAIPANGSIGSVAGQPDRPTLAVQFSSYVQPPSLYSLTPGRNATVSLVDQVTTDVDLGELRVRQQLVGSSDGAMIPVTIVHRAGLNHDNDNPVLLYGYGGFNISLLPEFNRSALYWLERGGVYAVANIRGGGEFGEEWHRAGNLLNKENVFEDFEAAIRYFIASGISRPERIAITGGSNGGLLMGALITRQPDLFQAAAAYVGLYDMVRYHHFPPAELWISEYGSSADPSQFQALHAYSPYHRVQDDWSYPAVLIETADHDTRVYWGHSTKFAARLQEATAADNPIYFYMVRSVGHGAGTRRSDLVQRYVRMFSFFESQLGMAPPQVAQ